MPIVDAELNIGNNIVDLVEKPAKSYLRKEGKVYKIEWTLNNKQYSEYITRETMEKLAKTGHVKHCQIANNSIYGVLVR